MPEASGGRKRGISPNARSTFYPRKRAVAACQLCRRRKTKCDNNRPACGFCTSIGASCVYQAPDADFSSFDQASLALLGKMDYIISLIEARSGSQINDSSPMATVTPGGIDHSTPTTVWPGASAANMASAESVEIPPRCNVTLRVLQWPILAHVNYNQILETLFVGQSHSISTLDPQSQGIIEDHIPSYVQRFLSNVHTKNPVLDHNLLLQYAREAAENGLRWDGPTCIVLMACALGLMSRPFCRTPVTAPEESNPDRLLADAYFTAARKRIGLLDPSSLLSIQTMFLSGIYEMYALRPLKAWAAFHAACSSMQLYYQTRQPDTESTATQNLEGRLYWSCFKSEREIRTEINLIPLRGSEWTSAKEFPMPPLEDVENNSPWFPLQESWYYYLTEILHRRTYDRILNEFYSHEDDSRWLTAMSDDIVRIALELEQQLTSTEANLPIWLRHSSDQPDERELPYFLHRRKLYLQELLFNPFLCRVIHSHTEQRPIVLDFARRCVEVCRVNILETAIQHRHHGSWFVARSAFRYGITLIAAVRSNKLPLPPDWAICIETAIATIDFWAKEAKDLEKLGQILRAYFSGINRQQRPASA